MGDRTSLDAEFQLYAKELDLINEKRERIVKASRDVTTHSKKVIFAVHRATGTNRELVLDQAEQDLAAVRNVHVSRIIKELQGNDIWKFRRAYSPGLQEYVEAATVLEFAKTSQLLSLQQLNQSLSAFKDASSTPFAISLPDYILGVGDLTGELMRLAVSGIAAGQLEAAISVCNFVRTLYEALIALPPIQDNLRDMTKKMETMLQNLIKIETACYNVHVRGSEYPHDIMIATLDGVQPYDMEEQ